jgi:hypothetical protein
MPIKQDVSVLAKLLNQTPDEILGAALSSYVDHVLDPKLRTIYNNFMEAASRATPNETKAVKPRFRISSKGSAMTFLPGKTKGRIMSELKNRIEFTREEFREAVARAMSWQPATGAFKISTKFHDLDAADRAWWGTLKGKDKIIEEAI